jgi:signal transduction histidine kinase
MQHRLLVVDDEPAQVRALCSSLNDHGYDATGFTNAAEALTELRQARFDVILADLAMPGMDGISLLREALAMDSFLVGVIMTGEGTIGTAIQAMQSGALDYVLKPFRFATIEPVIRRAVAMRTLRVENAALEAQVRQRTADLEASNRDLEAYAYSVSHDLRGPLHVINGLATLLEHRLPGPLPAETRELLQHITGSVEHMRQLIEALMRLSRMGQQTLNLEIFDLGSLVHGVVRDLQAQLAPAPLHVEFVTDLPAVQGDEALVRQVFINLLSNAHKFSRRTAVPLIEVGMEPDGAEPTYFVRDNGCGFDMAHADRLFKPFRRLHSGAEFEGTGIGLSIAQRIVQRHGGRIWAQAAVGQGACFHFTLSPPGAPAGPPDTADGIAGRG